MPVRQIFIKNYTQHQTIHYCTIFKRLLADSFIGQRLLRGDGFDCSSNYAVRSVVARLLNRLLDDFGFGNGNVPATHPKQETI